MNIWTPHLLSTPCFRCIVVSCLEVYWWSLYMHVHKKLKGIKTRIETITCFYGKGNEIISWCLFNVGSCLVLNDNCHYIRCRWSTLHQMWMNQINMTTFTKVRKLSVVMTISIHLHVWWQKKWKVYFCTWLHSLMW